MIQCLDIKKVIPLILSKHVYESQKKSNDKSKYLNIIIDEAHNILSYSSNRESETWKDYRLETFEEMIKEGRKFGTFLTLASQRPSEISETIFSQCNNFIAMRLTNPNDQNYVKKLLPDTLGNIIDELPTLRAGEALLLGESMVLPSIVQIEKCDLAPSSNDIPYWQLWKEEWKNLDFEELKKEWYK